MANDKFAIIKTGGKQYIVTEGQKLDVEKLSGKEGDKLSFDEVLLYKNGKVSIGQPIVEKVRVEGKILEQFKDKKKIVFKFKNKTRQTKLRGHRQPLTKVEITKISAVK